MIILLNIHPNFITDAKGKKISVVLPIKEYECMIEDLEDLEDIRLYDESKADKTAAISVDKAFKSIESKRKKK
jgi:hypothetical protein